MGKGGHVDDMFASAYLSGLMKSCCCVKTRCIYSSSGRCSLAKLTGYWTILDSFEP